MSSIVQSIPWMPERAWTVARSSCAISGLTRSDYSPPNVQPDPPCEATLPPGQAVAGDPPCTEDYVYDFTPVEAVGFQLDLTGYATANMAAMLASYDDRIVWWQLEAQWAEGPWVTIWRGNVLTDPIILGCDAQSVAWWQITAWGGCPPIYPECATSYFVSISVDPGSYDCQYTTTYTPTDQGIAPPTEQDCMPFIPNDCLPRYVPWRESRVPDFLGGQPRIDWTRSPGWTERDECYVPE